MQPQPCTTRVQRRRCARLAANHWLPVRFPSASFKRKSRQAFENKALFFTLSSCEIVAQGGFWLVTLPTVPMTAMQAVHGPLILQSLCG
jgi:hypothetical protein